MRKILFMCINMNVGGTEKALLNMLNEIDSSKYDVTLFMLEKYGEFSSQIPDFVKVNYFKKYNDIKPFIKEPPHILAKKLIKDKKYIKGLSTLFSYTISKIAKDISYYYGYLLKDYKKLNEEYDLAVAYAGPMDFITYFILNKVKAKKKIQWIHLDVSKIIFNKDFAEKNYIKFDKIFVVSEEAKNKLLKLIPSLQGKVDTFFNIISSSLIEEMSKKEKGFDDKFDGLRILTVGRLSKEKGQDLIIPIISRLKKNGYKIRWYFIGDGALLEECRKLSIDLKVENECIFLGTKLNPYPYMRECDIYVQPSRYECYCTTISEIKIFNKPIIFTNVNGAQELITNKETGIIVDIDMDDIYEAVKNMCIDHKLRNQISKNLQKFEKVDKNEISKLYEV